MLRDLTARPRLSGAPKLAAALAAVCSCLCAVPTGAGAVSRARTVAPLNMGFVQDQWPEAPWWNSKIRSLGGSYVRYEVPWAQEEPRRPAAGSDATNPANPAYEWQQYIDSEVRLASAAGLHVILTIDQAPPWAQGAGKPGSVLQGTWRPNATEFGRFARAIARRYSGSYPDPVNHGRSLPAVRSWIAWNEPNEPSELNPQWESVNGHIVPASPDVYRPMLNSFYANVKSVSSANQVISAGLAPFGDQPGGRRTPPLTFLRGLLCLNASLRPACGSVADFDATDMHPYSPKGPHWHAVNADDVSTPDIYKLNRVLSAAVRLHHVAPDRHKSVIVTEFSWDTNPPDPHGLSLQTQAKYLEDGFYTLWSQGVSTALWWRLTDQDPGRLGYPYTYQSGVLFETGGAKPSAAAYHFPFVAHHTSRTKFIAWGKVPGGGTVKIQRLLSRRWHTLATYRVSANHVFDVKLKLRGSAVLRAVAGSQVSLRWSLH